MKKIIASVIVISFLILSTTLNINAVQINQEKILKSTGSDHFKVYENGDIEICSLDDNMMVTGGEQKPDLVLLYLKVCWGYNYNEKVDVLYVKFSVRNIGCGFTPGRCKIGFYADGAARPFDTDILEPWFGGPAWEHWETLTYSNFCSNLTAKPNTVTAKVDCEDIIPESNESNNEKTCDYVPYAINISGYVYNKDDNGDLAPVFDCEIRTGKVPIFDGDEGDRVSFTKSNGFYQVIIFPYEPFDEIQDYHVRAHINNSKRQMKTVQNKEGDDIKLDFIFEGKPPRCILWPIGKLIARVGSSHTFLSFAFDMDKNDEIYYLFDWGDGTYSYWLGPYKSFEMCKASHIYTFKWNRIIDTREIRFIAKDSYDNLSPISYSAIIVLI